MLSNLPPGVSNYDIEKAAGAFDDEETDEIVCEDCQATSLPCNCCEWCEMFPCECDDQPDESDAYITDRPRGGYDVSFDGKFLGNFTERDEAEAAIRAQMEKSQFWPNVWFVSDHGNMHLVTL